MVVSGRVGSCSQDGDVWKPDCNGRSSEVLAEGDVEFGERREVCENGQYGIGDVVAPAEREVGEFWKRSEVSDASEGDFASAHVQNESFEGGEFGDALEDLWVEMFAPTEVQHPESGHRLQGGECAFAKLFSQSFQFEVLEVTEMR